MGGVGGQSMTEIVWFRRDARLDDNPALSAAARQGDVCALFVIDPTLFYAVSERRRDLLVAGLHDLDRRMRDRGGRLRISTGDPTDVVPAVALEIGARAVHVNAEVTPYGIRRDRAVGQRVELFEHEGIYAAPPGSILTNQGEPYRVFTAFHAKWTMLRHEPTGEPEGLRLLDMPGEGLPDEVDTEIPSGETGALARLAAFERRVNDYGDGRDRIDRDETSHLSVDLKYGWLGARRLLSRVGAQSDGRRAFRRQLAWRDFYGQVMAANPSVADEALDDRYREIEWRHDEDEIGAWKRGETGYPLVDAAMRRLVAEGAMHNRARMITASFLVKDLLVDWRIGERFFRHHLLDGDVAQNAGNWQWVAGTGTDAAPYFRVFNPVTQSERFDPDGSFIRRWLPELDGIPGHAIHAPWELAPLELASYGVELGVDYPPPIVDHAVARQRAIAAYKAATGSL